MITSDLEAGWQQIIVRISSWKLPVRHYKEENTAPDFWKELCRIAEDVKGKIPAYRLLSIDIHSVQGIAEARYTFVSPTYGSS